MKSRSRDQHRRRARRIVPMTADFRTLVERMRGAEAPANDVPVFRMQTALGSLATACNVVGVPHMTPHDLRHLFANLLHRQSQTGPPARDRFTGAPCAGVP
jgi:integrase